MGSFLVLHASVTEYVLLFGTGIQTSGNSGKCTILSLVVERYNRIVEFMFSQFASIFCDISNP